MEYREFLAFGAAHTSWWYLGRAVHIRFESWLFAALHVCVSPNRRDDWDPPWQHETKDYHKHCQTTGDGSYTGEWACTHGNGSESAGYERKTDEKSRLRKTFTDLLA